MKQSCVIAIVLQIASTVATDFGNTDNWSAVNNTNIFHELDTCAQSCIQSVNTRIWDASQNKYCVSQGCVCSNSTHGENFANGEGNITSCVIQNCGSEGVDAAKRAFGDLCLVYALNSTRPEAQSGKIYRIEAEGYEDLSKCAKFAINGCLDIDGTRNEAECGPRLTPENWNLYKGIAEQRSCSSSGCLCEDSNFDTTISVALDAGREYCAMRPSTKSLPNPEANAMLNVIASYCFSYGFAHRNFTYTYEGKTPGSEKPEGMTIGDKAQTGVASAALFVALIALYPVLRAFWLVIKAKATRSSRTSAAQVASPPTPSSQSSHSITTVQVVPKK